MEDSANMEKKARLDRLTDDLLALVCDEDLDEEKLTEASEGLLPQLCDALGESGYGTFEEPETSDLTTN